MAKKKKSKKKAAEQKPIVAFFFYGNLDGLGDATRKFAEEAKLKDAFEQLLTAIVMSTQPERQTPHSTQ